MAPVSARDVKQGKPHPEGYLLGYKLLNRLPAFRKNPLKASECLAIEDSIRARPLTPSSSETSRTSVS